MSPPHASTSSTSTTSTSAHQPTLGGTSLPSVQARYSLISDPFSRCQAQNRSVFPYRPSIWAPGSGHELLPQLLQRKKPILPPHPTRPHPSRSARICAPVNIQASILLRALLTARLNRSLLRFDDRVPICCLCIHQGTATQVRHGLRRHPSWETNLAPQLTELA